MLPIDEEDEQVGYDAQDELQNPGVKGHVDVEDIALLSLSEDFGVNDISNTVGVLHNVAERQRI